ncbi:AraC family transcriptional regulator [Sphingobacterium sp. LRF_L2]|uniref:helix-turn-helix transcriptional regulator n=1 Tax=Sphingobacterium sp. LRF_L2 TaxID=3369421 RepID=UPI003F5E68F7
MSTKQLSIPLNPILSELDADILIARAEVDSLALHEKIQQAHRDNYHLFCVQEKGTSFFEIDFQKYKITGPAIIYIQPNQVHRAISLDNVVLSTLIINNDNVHPEYLKALQEIAPTKPLLIQQELLDVLVQTITLCLTFSERRQDRLSHSILKDCCNSFIGLIASPYLNQNASGDKLSRFETIYKSFQFILEKNFTTFKNASAYAQQLNISSPYLNECIRKATGYPVSYHIQQRVMLEAKRLLYHTDKSVKTISAELGYDDYPYFTRLFKKVVGTTAIGFRNKKP